MSQFLGDFECKLDAKGRLSFPSALRKKMPPEAQDKFVINRGYENCLQLFPYNEWILKSKAVDALDLDDPESRDYHRWFYRGATEVELDAAGRILIPKLLCDHAGIDKELFLCASGVKIEIWSKERYLKRISEEPDDISALGKKVMSKPKLGGLLGGLS
jgi:MraZ protein